MRDRRLDLEIFLVSLAAILLEVSYTRVFSYKLVYYFTYVIIGIALLGLGSGGVFVTLFPRLRRAAPSPLVPVCCLLAAASVLGGYVVVALTPVNAIALTTHLVPFDAPLLVLRETAKLGLVCACLFVPFFAAGLVIAAIFATRTERIARLYCADLLGASLGCAAAVPLMTTVSPVGSIVLAGFVFALAGLRPAAVDRRALLWPLVPLAGALLVAAMAPGRLPDPVPDDAKTMAGARRGRVHFSRWSPVFRVDVVPSLALTERRRLIMHDGMTGSILLRFDGDLGALGFETNVRALPFEVVPPEPQVAVIGAAGGHEILASLYFDAAHVTAVELNPVTVSLLTTHFADYTGHLAEHERVTLLNGEGRWFLASDTTVYDLVWFVAPDSYAAMNAATSGAFVLSESYLYTVEMIVDTLRHLGPYGVVCAQFGEVDFAHKPNRTTRYLTTAREAFRRVGITDFARHVIVTTTPGLFDTATVLLRPTPFTAAEVARVRERAAAVPGTTVRHPRVADGSPDPIAAAAGLPAAALERWYAGYPFAVGPVTDDAPFFWHFVRFRDAFRPLGRHGVTFYEEGTGERLLVVLLLVVTAFAALVLLLPMVLRREVWRTIPHKGAAGVFFASIGLGFMFLEVVLIQRLTLFLGYPTYSLTVTLFALLVSTGVGSLSSERWGEARDAVMRRLAAALVVLVLLAGFVAPPLLARGIGWPFALRVATAVAVVAPLGVCLGAFMPLGLGTVAALTPRREEYVAWCWAVNGFFSVVSSVLATVLAMALGFDAVTLCALAVYLVGVAAFLRLPQRPAALSSAARSGV